MAGEILLFTSTARFEAGRDSHIDDFRNSGSKKLAETVEERTRSDGEDGIETVKELDKEILSKTISSDFQELRAVLLQ